jgi:subtilase family serine protease
MIPATLAPRSYYLWMTVDATNTEAETNETNNVLVGNAITIIRNVDLVATSVSTAATANIGTGITITSTVTNTGTTITAANSAVQYHLSTSATNNTKALLLGSSLTSGLASGASSVLTTSVMIPATLAPRSYYLWMTVDATNTEAETNETNNVLVGNVIAVN